MPNYFFTAKSLSNKTATGTMQAKDTRELAKTLKDDGLVLVKAVVVGSNKKWYNFSFGKGISATEKIMMANIQYM